MTKEEIIEALQDDEMMPFIQPEHLAQIVDFVIKNYHPSLPSNLDNAAEDYAENILAGGEDMFDAIADGFKAGAGWLAEQGQTFEAHVDNGCAIASGVKLPFILWDTYEDGDVLKVQIRKKQ